MVRVVMKSQCLRHFILPASASALVHRPYVTRTLVNNQLLQQPTLAGRDAAGVLPPGFAFYPHFLDSAEQRILLQAALEKLDKQTGSRKFKQKRKSYNQLDKENVNNSNNIEGIFLPENYYEFEDGHFDGVITKYRETHITSWPQHDSLLEPILHKIYSLLPCAKHDIQTHLLHLASEGRILPHIDNVEASGSWIAGISLGGERVLRLEDGNGDMFQILLCSGSAYVQSGDVRFTYKHSILPGGGVFTAGQRLSVMLRDQPQARL